MDIEHARLAAQLDTLTRQHNDLAVKQAIICRDVDWMKASLKMLIGFVVPALISIGGYLTLKYIEGDRDGTIRIERDGTSYREGTKRTVSYTHLTLPTTPYV